MGDRVGALARALTMQTERAEALEAAIRAWVRAHDDWHRGIAPVHLLHEAERKLREVLE